MHVGINAHLLSFSSSYRGAGISRYIRSLIPYLRDQARSNGEQYTVFLGDPHYPPEFEPGPAFHLDISCLPTVRPPVRILWEQLILPIGLKRLGLDLLHSMGYVQPLGCSCRSVVTVHDLSFVLFPRTFNSTNRIYLTHLTRLSTRRADRVIAVSENTRQDLIKLFDLPPHKVVAIHHGVEEMFRPIADPSQLRAFRAAQGLPEHYVLFIGTLEPRKNVHNLIKAFAAVKKAGLPHKLVIGGAKGWLWRDIFATVSGLGLEKDVIFPGYIALEVEPLWYNGADLFVYPSLYEGFGFPPLEAMACGVPVVTSNCSSLPEVVGEAGLLVDPTSIGELADAMLAALTDDAMREKMRGMGLERVRSFSWADAAAKTVQAYRSAMAAR